VDSLAVIAPLARSSMLCIAVDFVIEAKRAEKSLQKYVCAKSDPIHWHKSYLKTKPIFCNSLCLKKNKTTQVNERNRLDIKSIDNV